MQARYYDPVVGRFMAVDPVVFTGNRPEKFGRYTYTNNNPVNLVDPDGKDSTPADWAEQRAAKKSQSVEGKTATSSFRIGPLSGPAAEEMNRQSAYLNSVTSTAAGAAAGFPVSPPVAGVLVAAVVGIQVGDYLNAGTPQLHEGDTMEVETTIEFNSYTDSGHTVVDQKITITKENGELRFPAPKEEADRATME